MNKIIICIHNFFVVINLQTIIKELSKNYSITLVTTSQNLNLSKDEIDGYKKELNVNELLLLPIYKNKEENIFELIKSFSIIKKLLKNNNFVGCIVDNNLDVWLKIITNDFKKNNKKIIAIKHDSLALNTLKVQEFLFNGNIENILDKSHKLRDIKSKVDYKKKDINEGSKFFLKLKKIKKFKNLFFKRYLLPFIFFKKIFGYSKLDLATGFDDKTIDYVICLFYTGYIFWGSLYSYERTFYVSYENNCKCSHLDQKNKKKILFLGSLLWENDLNLLKNQIFNFKKFVNKLINENENINQIDIKFHPEETYVNIKKLKKLISENSIQIKINYIDQVSLIEDSCNYVAAFGMISSSLFYVSNSCKLIDVYCPKSLSSHYFKKYYLKLFNENIIFYDDYNNSIQDQSIIYKNMIFDKKIPKNDIISVIKKILN